MSDSAAQTETPKTAQIELHGYSVAPMPDKRRASGKLAGNVLALLLDVVDLISARNVLGLSQSQMGRALGAALKRRAYDRSTVSMYERQQKEKYIADKVFRKHRAAPANVLAAYNYLLEQLAAHATQNTVRVRCKVEAFATPKQKWIFTVTRRCSKCKRRFSFQLTKSTYRFVNCERCRAG